MPTITIRHVPEDEWRELRHLAIERGISLQALALHLLQLGIAADRQESNETEQPIETERTGDK